jgi:hypothetical protein
MGCFASKEDKEAAQRNAQIERELKLAKETAKNEVKMLLLGAQSPFG